MDLQEASKALIKAIHESQEFKDAMIDCIVSALREYNLPFMPEDELATHILNRIVGDE